MVIKLIGDVIKHIGSFSWFRVFRVIAYRAAGGAQLLAEGKAASNVFTFFLGASAEGIATWVHNEEGFARVAISGSSYARWRSQPLGWFKHTLPLDGGH